MPTYLLIKCSDVSSVFVLNTVGFLSRSFWDTLCSIGVMGMKTTSTAAWVHWPLKKIWPDHFICSMTAHNVTCGGLHSCCIAKCGLPFAQKRPGINGHYGVFDTYPWRRNFLEACQEEITMFSRLSLHRFSGLQSIRAWLRMKMRNQFFFFNFY